MQIEDACAAFCESLLVHEDLSPNTVRAYQTDVAAFINFVGPSRNASELNENDLQAFTEELLTSELCRSSARRRISGVRRFCRWLVQTEILLDDPSSACRIAPSRQRRLPRALTSSEASALLRFVTNTRQDDAAGEPPNATTLAIQILIATGLRGGELVKARVRDVDLVGGSLRVTGKGRRERVVFLPTRPVLVELRTYLSARQAQDGDPLLARHDGCALSSATLRSLVASAARQSGIQRHVTPHMLRHTAATQYLDAGVDIRVLQRLLGHASIATTEIYTHVADHSLKEEVTRAALLERLL